MGVETRPYALTALARSLDEVAERIGAGDIFAIAPLDVGDQPCDDVAEMVAAADRLVAAVRRSHALEAAVHELFEAMSSHLRLDYLSYEALYRLIDHTGAAGGAVVLTGNCPPDVVASVEWPIEGEALTELIASVPTGLVPCELDQQRIVAVPFVGDSGPLGAVLLLDLALDSGLRRLLALLARALGFAVSNALAHAAAETQASTDGLTGCANRRAGLDSLSQAARLAAHGGPPVGVMMIDLDHFKRINDRYGHQVGDDVLRAAGGAIATAMRDSDIVMRYGGEEFLVAITDAEEGILLRLADRLSDRIRALTVPDGAGATVALTTSVGLSVWVDGDSVESLIERADRALYDAKAAGRDRVVLGR